MNALREAVRLLIHRWVKNPLLYNLLAKTLIPLAHCIENGHKKYVLENAVSNLFDKQDVRVKHGIFAGMRYPECTAIGSTFFPKILGSYERELHGVFERIFKNDYTEIVDVGCAEGYYAIGLAMRFPNAKVYAYDIATEAIRLCNVMAQINGVSDRVITGMKCDPEVLLSIPFRDVP